jgi:hypothetical protein
LVPAVCGVVEGNPLPVGTRCGRGRGNELPHRIGGWSFCLFLCPSCFIVPQNFEVELRHPRLTRLVPNPDHQSSSDVFIIQEN